MNIFKSSLFSRTHNVNTSEKYLVIGFFNRGNIGDEAYILAYKHLFPNVELIFSSIDDTHSIPKDINIVIVAGGDIVNKYFMPKIQLLLRTYCGPCYAFSVGIPFKADAKYINTFDHIVLRSQQDINIASSVLGEENVGYLPDVTWMLASSSTSKDKINVKTPNRIGIALAQPSFYKNAKESSLIDSIVEFIFNLMHKFPQTEINLLSFNTSIYEKESDYIINEKIYNRLSVYQHVTNCKQTNLRCPLAMLKFIGKHDLIIGMRYHSIMFSMIQNIPCVAIYSTQKMDNLMIDNNLLNFAYKLPTDEHYMPTEIDPKKLTSLVLDRLKTPFIPIKVDPQKYTILQNVCKEKKNKRLLIHKVQNTLEQTLIQCQKQITNVLKIDETLMKKWFDKNISTNNLLSSCKKTSIELAKVICFAITDKIGSPYVWGLNENMVKTDFSIVDAIKWIYEDNYIHNIEISNNYYPLIKCQRSVIIDLNYMSQDNYRGLHRSGWSYVMGGLQQLDGTNLNKTSSIMIDACVERTFMWGLDITKSCNIVPYGKPWAGFVHHTFNTTYSNYNCVALLEVPEFLKSLEHCKCLFVLSHYLMHQMNAALKNIGKENIPVINLTHPTEFVEDKFTMAKFLINPDRKVVQIGAWLRNPYAIRALPLPPNNKLGIQKAALKGKEMDNYFCPTWMFKKLDDNLDVNTTLYNADTGAHTVSRIETCSNKDGNSIPLFVNKYVEGMLKHIKECEQSVQVLENLENKDYDSLLSHNIVFLNLVDASASNTVVECIVRNTPIVINRHPALEEILGIHYPGFYNNLYEAATKVMDMNYIQAMYEYLNNMDKTKLTLSFFISDFQDKLSKVLSK